MGHQVLGDMERAGQHELHVVSARGRRGRRRDDDPAMRRNVANAPMGAWNNANVRYTILDLGHDLAPCGVGFEVGALNLVKQDGNSVVVFAEFRVEKIF